MPGATTIDAIADDIREAHAVSPEHGARVLCGYFAKKVEAGTSVPEQPGGIVDGAQILAVRMAEFEASRRAFPDYDQHVTIDVVGDELVCDFTMAGTPPDGDRLQMTVHAEYTVNDGEITKVVMDFDDPANATRLFQVLAAAGFQMPDAETLR